METAGLYLLRSAVWITGFALVYILFLRNERFFLLNRIYLITGIIASVILPMVTVRYMVEASDVEAGVSAGPVTATLHGGSLWQEILSLALFSIWLAGVLAVIVRYVIQVLPVFRDAARVDWSSDYPVKVIRSEEYPGSFSLFSFVVVNPSVSETEAREIMNHELVHIRQMHWFDLVLSSVLCAVQWFNPVAWIYSRFIRQNHEYLADEEALQRSSDPAVYRAVLLNQIAGSPVIDLGNFLSYSLNKKRFLMMKNKISSPYRKLRLLLILPVAALVLFAFAKPEYRVMEGSDGPLPAVAAADNAVKSISGTVKDVNGKPLEGAVIVIKGSTVGTTSDASGRFALKDVPDDAVLYVSYVGFETKVISIKAAGNNLAVTMKVSTVVTDTVSVSTVPPPPPPPPPLPTAKSGSSVVPEGENSGEEVFVVVEEMPEFPGGQDAMMLWLAQNIKYPEQAKREKIQGVVVVNFVVSKTGKISNVTVIRSVNPLLDAESIRVIGEMPEWKPGTQKGRAVDVKYTVPVKFSLQ